MCKTRWVERHEAFEVFLDLYQPLVCCLEEIKDSASSEWNHNIRKDAQSQFLPLTRFPFIFSLVVTKEVLGYTKALSTKLQGQYIDVVRAYKEVSFVQEVLESTRKDVESFHNRSYAAALAIARKVNVDGSLPRTTGRQQHRCNVSSSSPPEYYKCQLTIPALDYLTSEISERFSSCFSTILSQIMKLLPLSVAESEEEVSSAHISDLVTFYEDDLPTLSSIDTELHCWAAKWKGNLDEARNTDTPQKAIALMVIFSPT